MEKGRIDTNPRVGGFPLYDRSRRHICITCWNGGSDGGRGDEECYGES